VCVKRLIAVSKQFHGENVVRIIFKVLLYELNCVVVT